MSLRPERLACISRCFFQGWLARSCREIPPQRGTSPLRRYIGPSCDKDPLWYSLGGWQNMAPAAQIGSRLDRCMRLRQAALLSQRLSSSRPPSYDAVQPHQFCTTWIAIGNLRRRTFSWLPCPCTPPVSRETLAEASMRGKRSDASYWPHAGPIWS